MGRHVLEGQLRRAALFNPLREEPTQISPGGFRKDSLHIVPVRMTPSILHHETFERTPKWLLSDFLSEQMEDHRRLLVADRVVTLISFVRELSNWVVACWRHMQIIAA